MIDSAAPIHGACVFQEPKGMLQGRCKLISLLSNLGRPSPAQVRVARSWLQ